MRTVLFDGKKVKIRSRSTEIGGAWRKHKSDGSPFAWDSAVIEFFFRRTKKIQNPVVLDIGANTGTFSLLPKFHEGMVVHAFEPSPLPYELLCKNIKLNSLESRVHIYCYALSDKTGQAMLKVPRRRDGTYFQSGMACLGRPARFSEMEHVEVETRRLDDLGLGRIHFLKIDVEGHELFVLRGGEEVIRSQQPGIMIEYKNENTEQFGYEASEILSLLTSWGYSRFHGVGRNDVWCE